MSDSFVTVQVTPSATARMGTFFDTVRSEHFTKQFLTNPDFNTIPPRLNTLITNTANLTTIVTNTTNVNTNLATVVTNTGNLATIVTNTSHLDAIRITNNSLPTIATNTTNVNTNLATVVTNTGNLATIVTNTNHLDAIRITNNSLPTIATNTTNVNTNLATVVTNTGNLATIVSNTANVSTNLANVLGRLDGVALRPLANSLNAPSSFRNAGLTNTALAVKTTAGGVLGWNFINLNNVVVYVKFYNAATVTVGTTPVVSTLAIPPNGTLVFMSGYIWEWFTNSIKVACVTGIADNNNVAPAIPIYAEIKFV